MPHRPVNFAICDSLREIQGIKLQSNSIQQEVRKYCNGASFSWQETDNQAKRQNPSVGEDFFKKDYPGCMITLYIFDLKDFTFGQIYNSLN